MGKSESDWRWWASRDEENYTTGPERSREAVIALAIIDFDGEPFHIVEAQEKGVDGLLPTAERLVQDYLERAADDGEFGEDGDYDLRGKAEQHAEAYADLDQAIAAWLAKWRHLLPTPWAFEASRNGEWIALPHPKPEGEG